MSKKYVIDTSVLIYDPNCLSKFKDNIVIIPSVVLEEINKLKEENSERGYCARQVSMTLESLSLQNSLKQGVKLDETHILTDYSCSNEEIIKSFSMDEFDYKIIACAKNNNAILISRDRMMRVFARDFDIQSEEYEADMVKNKELYKGYKKELVSGYIIEKLFKEKTINNDYKLYPNQFIILQDESNPNRTAIGICKNNSIKCVDFNKMNLSGLKTTPMNLEQKMLNYLLLDNDIKCISIVGVSGKGKSLISIDYALANIYNERFNKFLYTKSTKSVDESETLGFYKGDATEKLKPHLQPLYSCIEFLLKDEMKKEKISVEQKVEKLMNSDILAFYPLANIRGMSVSHKVVMLDEAQNTTKHMIKSLVTRVSDNSKLIIAGDIAQIDDKNLNKYNNGLVHLIEAGKSEEYIAHITMDIDDKSRRGKLSGFGSNKL